LALRCDVVLPFLLSYAIYCIPTPARSVLLSNSSHCLKDKPQKNTLCLPNYRMVTCRNNDVFQQVDAQDFACFAQTLCDFDVGRAWLERAAWVAL